MSLDRFSFLQEKAANFRVFILGQSPDAEVTAQVDGFKPEMLLPTLTGVLLPALQARGKESLVDELLSHLTPADPVAVRAKILRYFDCFQEVLTQ